MSSEKGSSRPVHTSLIGGSFHGTCDSFEGDSGRKGEGEIITVYSDSESIINSLISPITSFRLIREIKKIIRPLEPRKGR